MARWAAPELISAALTGDEAAAERVIAVVWPSCFRLAATVIGDWNLAQDAAQEACVIIHQKIRNLRNVGALDVWLYRIVMCESNRVRRRHEMAGRPTYEDRFGRDDTTTLDVWRALAELSPELRDVTVLFYFDDLKTAGIAATLGIPHPTVRTRLARARERLRAILTNYSVKFLPERTESKQRGF